MVRYFTSDTHFWHQGVLDYDDRPFKTVEEMNQALIVLWNNAVSKSDVVYHLGDFCWAGPNKAVKILDQLNGQIHLIQGNHDKLNQNLRKRFVTVDWMKKVKINIGSKRYNLVLSHYPYRTWAGMGRNVYNVHGHSHGKLFPLPGAMDVGCNLWGYAPVHEDVVIERLTVGL